MTIDALVRTVLYEGYTLYPYRPSALKNTKRFAFGSVYPRGWAERAHEPFTMRTECVFAKEAPDARVAITVRFLALHRGGGAEEHAIELAPIALASGGGAEEHAIELAPIALAHADGQGRRHESGSNDARSTESRHESSSHDPLGGTRHESSSHDLLGGTRHESSSHDPLGGTRHESSSHGARSAPTRRESWSHGAFSIELALSACADGALWRVAIEIENVTELSPDADREAAMDVTLASTHTVLVGHHARAISMIDPPADAADAVAACRTLGTYPVVVGSDTMLASPIVLPDFPALAATSPGDFFDGTEMDEMLTLRVLTLTDAEKSEAAAADPRIAALLARTEQRGIAETSRLHGVTQLGNLGLTIGSRVIVRPRGRADAFDVILAGMRATVVAIERDLDGRIHCAVTIDDDPGADHGAAGLPGHRFFFRPDELEAA